MPTQPDRVVELKLGDRKYRLNLHELGPADDRECRRITEPDRYSVLQLVQAFQTEPGTDRLAAVLYLAERQAGKKTTIEEIEGQITYAMLLDAVAQVNDDDEVEEGN